MEEEITKLFGIQDIGFMIAIGVVAWVCKRTARIPEDLALLIPLVLGAIVGGIQSWNTATFGSGILIKGIIVTAAGATIAARLADELLVRVGLIKKAEEKPSTAPKEELPPPEPPAAA
jgi:uncharacterized membrane protein AbrB (regulator of aidB expression)